MIQIITLGRFGVLVDGEARHFGLGAQARLIPVILALNAPAALRREQLVEMIAPDASPSAARQILNTALWRLRKALAVSDGASFKTIQSNAEEVCFHPSATISFDAADVNACVSNIVASGIAQGGDLSDELFQRLRTAFEAYQGPFLEGFDNEWIWFERERTNNAVLHGGMILSSALVARGQIDSAISVVHNLLRVDPLDEAVQCQYMLLMGLGGRRSRAIENYELFSESLSRECGIRPMQKTRRLLNQLKSNEFYEDLPQHLKQASEIAQRHMVA